MTKKSKGCLTDLLVLGGMMTTLGLASLTQVDGCRLGSGHTSGESEPKPERVVELPKIEAQKIEEPKKQEGYLDILVDLNQKLGNERETLTKVDLPDLLKSSKVGPTTVSQYIRFARQGVSNQGITDDEDPKTRTVIETSNGPAFYVAENDPIFEYELEFERGFVSRTDSNGSLVDLVGSQLDILGQTYRVVRANYNQINDLELVLASGKVREYIPIPRAKDIFIKDGKDYWIELIDFDAKEGATFRINEEITTELGPGEFYVLKDGTLFMNLGIPSMRELYKGVEPEGIVIIKSEYMFPSSVIKISDSNIQDDKFKEQVTVNETQIGGEGFTKIKWQVLPNRNIEIQSIEYRCLCDSREDHVLLKKGEYLRNQLDTTETLLSTKFNISYQGQHKNGKHIVRIHEK